LRWSTLSLLLASGADARADGGTCSPNFPPPTGAIAYHDGPIVSAAQVVPVMWTSAVDPTISSWASGYFSTLTGSAWFDLLGQYSTPGADAGGTGQALGRGTATQSYVITPTTVSGNLVDDSQIGPELHAQIAAHVLPAPIIDPQGFATTIYAVFFPSGTSITWNGSTSCAEFCAYHGAYPATGSASFLYLVAPDMGPASGCDGCIDSCTTGNLALTRGAVSSVLAGALTDPNLTLGWFQASTGEVDAYCYGGPSTTGTVPGTSIIAHYVWSQHDGVCLLGSSPSSINPFGSSSGGASSGAGSGAGSSGGGGSGSGGASPQGGCGCTLLGDASSGAGLATLVGIVLVGAARLRRRR
jgi:hypothetical protein